MKDKLLDELVQEIMAIRTSSFSFLGMGTGPDQAIFRLRKSMMAYVNEFQKSDQSKTLLASLAGEIEGCLEVLATLSVLSTKRLKELTEKLYSLSN